MAMPVQQVFKRVEKKYLVDSEQYNGLMPVLTEHMKADEYGLHTICNVYYDNLNNDLIRVSIEKPVYKEKFRVRSYGIPSDDDTVFLEIKKKAQGVVYKRRIPFKMRDAREVLKKISESDKMSGIIVGIDVNDSNYPVFDDVSNRQIMHEIEYIIKHYNLVPDTYVAYDRIALFGLEEPDLRITFDKNIRTRKDRLSLSEGDSGEVILEDGKYIMEVKTNGSMPLWLAKKISEMELYPFSFSKIGTAYKKKITGGIGQ